MKVKRPFLVTFIGDINILVALLWIVSLFPKFYHRIGIIFEPLFIYDNYLLRLVIPIMLLIISFGYLRLKMWSYWSLIAINIFFLIAAAIVAREQQSAYSAVITSVINLLFILRTKEYFIRKTRSSETQ